MSQYVTVQFNKSKFRIFSETEQHGPSDITLTLHLPLISAIYARCTERTAAQ